MAQCLKVSSVVGHSKEAAAAPPAEPFARCLRKRRLNLNGLSNVLTCPAVCEFPNCGMQLKDGSSLMWHHEGHLGQEVERLDKIRVKRPPPDEARLLRRNVRDSAVDRIRFNRERRLASKTGAGGEDLTLRCPVCQVEADHQEVEYVRHLETCLQTHHPSPSVPEEEEEEELDVEEYVQGETYTWAGHTRVRATSLVEGGLRGASGFVTITRGDEDVELDIENDVHGSRWMSAQYTEADVIPPSSESDKEKEERLSIAQVLIGSSSSSSNDILCKPSDPDEITESSSLMKHKKTGEMSLSELRLALEQLREENGALRQQTLCNICFDSYTRPVASVICWHVHCELCWLRALGSKKLCPQCKIITQPQDLRRIFL